MLPFFLLLVLGNALGVGQKDQTLLEPSAFLALSQSGTSGTSLPPPDSDNCFWQLQTGTTTTCSAGGTLLCDSSPCGAQSVSPTGSRQCTFQGTTKSTYVHKPKNLCDSCVSCAQKSFTLISACSAIAACYCKSSTGSIVLCTSPPPTVPPVLPPCPLGEWSQWGKCMFGSQEAACIREFNYVQQGQKTRTKSPIVSSTCNGNVNTQSESISCTPDCPPEHCLMGDWMPMTVCPDCWNRGLELFQPMYSEMAWILQKALFGGEDCDGENCPVRDDVNNVCYRDSPCLIPACPIDCEVGEWSDWCPCDKKCFDTVHDCSNCGGRTHRTRIVTRYSSDGGVPCPHLYEVKGCNEDPCPINCEMTTWTPWTQCSADCGGGQITRTRRVTVFDRYGGEPCGDVYESQPCNEQPCPESCTVTEWGDWNRVCSECIKEGAQPETRKKSRDIAHIATNGGSECPSLVYEENCPLKYCRIDCEYTEWTEPTACSATCGGGKTFQQRSVRTPARYGGTECSEPLYKEDPCNEQPCDKDCVYTWEQFVDPETGLYCSKPCGGGTHVRKLTVLQQPVGNGAKCPPPEEEEPCNTQCCPQDCVISEFTPSIEECQTTSCPTSGCGVQLCKRQATILVNASCGGSACPGIVDWIPCKVKECEKTCVWSEYSGWTRCEGCGPTDQKRYRTSTLLQGNVEDCTEDGNPEITQEEPCVLPGCPVDCEVGEWVDGPCSVSCGVGHQVQTREVTNDGAAYGGRPCPYLKQVVPCIQPACIPPCKLSEWTEFGPCSATCHANDQPSPYQERTRTVLVVGDNACDKEPRSDTRDCNSDVPCPTHCLLSDWSDWIPAKCGWNEQEGKQHCGLNTQTRSRSIITEPKDGGRQCQITEESQFCQGPPCEKPCEFTPWGDWSAPTATCGTSYHSRKRFLMNAGSEAELTACPELQQTEKAPGLPECPINCEFYYGPWGECNEQGYRRRDVFIKTEGQFGGKKCPTCRRERDDCTPPIADNECWLEDCDTSLPV